ncbi:MAG: EAL domain-containing protein, partial [Janthinobacterium lividum]
VDKSFVQGMATQSEDGAIIRAILYLARNLGFSAIAEGIETQDQAERLRKKGCEEVQGYLFGHPVPAAEFTALIAQHSEKQTNQSNSLLRKLNML